MLDGPFTTLIPGSPLKPRSMKLRMPGSALPPPSRSSAVCALHAAAQHVCPSWACSARAPFTQQLSTCALHAAAQLCAPFLGLLLAIHTEASPPLSCLPRPDLGRVSPVHTLQAYFQPLVLWEHSSLLLTPFRPASSH